jgi:hypothetical protein
VNFLTHDLFVAAKRALRPLLAATVLGGTLAGYNVGAQAITPVEAAPAPIYWGGYVDGAPYQSAKLDQFETDAGKKQSIVHWGQPWMSYSNGNYQVFQTTMYEKVRARGGIPLIDWGSWSLGGGAVNQPNFQLADIYNGHHDAYITSWAKSAKAWGHPFFLRFDHEMNGNWFSWSERVNGNKPGEFIKAWRHVHDIFTSVGANNVTWVWCPNLASATTTPLAEMYPGDAYVDWTGMDGYNWGTDKGNKWYAFDQVFGMNPWTKHSTYADILKFAPNKPMMIGETATSKDGGDEAAWVKDALLTQLPKYYPAVKALVWFNWNAGDTNLEWPIESTPALKTAFKEAIGSSYYVDNQFANLPSGKIKAYGASSTPSSTPTPAPTQPVQQPTSVPSGSSSVTLISDRDSYTYSTSPDSTAGGASTTLRSTTAGGSVAYVRFDLASLHGKTLTSVKLRVKASTSGSDVAHHVKFVSDDTWSEKYLSFNNTIDASSTGDTLASLMAPTANTWYTVALPVSAIQGEAGTSVSLAISASTSDLLNIYSREAGDSAPQLIVGYK